MASTRIASPVIAAAVAVALAATVLGCGSSGSSSSPSGAGGTSPAAGSPAAAGALSAEAQSAATGDIPDNQLFLTLVNGAAGYAIKYPEGWTQSGAAADVTLRDKNNIVHIVVGRGGPQPTVASTASQLEALRRADPTLTFKAPQVTQLGATRAIKATYTTQSAPNPVTGKSVLLLVDRYELAGHGRAATVDLGTPKGVDNVDAYRMMIESFTWR